MPLVSRQEIFSFPRKANGTTHIDRHRGEDLKLDNSNCNPKEEFLASYITDSGTIHSYHTECCWFQVPMFFGRVGWDIRSQFSVS